MKKSEGFQEYAKNVSKSPKTYGCTKENYYVKTVGFK